MVVRPHMLKLLECLTPEATFNYRKHASKMAGDMAKVMRDHLEATRELPVEERPDPKALGTACFVAGFILSIDLDDEEYRQLCEALVAMLLANEPSSKLLLATLPPPLNAYN